MKCNFRPLLLVVRDLHCRGSSSEQDDFSFILHLDYTRLQYYGTIQYGTAMKIFINKQNINNICLLNDVGASEWYEYV